MVDIVSLLSSDGYIMCNKTLIKLFGADCAILIGELCAEYNYYKTLGKVETDNSFYSTQENIEDNTGLNGYAQRKALKTLTENGIISVIKKGMPAKNYYTIEVEQLLKIFTTSDLKFKPQVIENLNLNNNKQKTINKKENNSKELLEKSPSKRKLINPIESEIVVTPKPKKKSSSLYTKCVDMILEYTQDDKSIALLKQYLEMRLAIKDKPMYANQWKGLLNKLDKLAETEEVLQQIVSQSIELGYASFYPYNPNIGKGGGNYDWHTDAANVDVKTKKMTKEDKEKLEKEIERRKQSGQRVAF